MIEVAFVPKFTHRKDVQNDEAGACCLRAVTAALMSGHAALLPRLVVEVAVVLTGDVVAVDGGLVDVNVLVGVDVLLAVLLGVELDVDFALTNVASKKTNAKNRAMS